MHGAVTGIKAESAYDQLIGLGFKKVNFFGAVPQIDKDDRYRITQNKSASLYS